MRVEFTDTDPAAERLRVALLRAAGSTRRLALALSLTDTVDGLAPGAIARTLHVADRTEVRVRFVELHHGGDLAEAIRRRLIGLLRGAFRVPRPGILACRRAGVRRR